MPTFQQVENQYLWAGPGAGIFNIEDCKMVAYRTTLLSSDNQIIFPPFENYRDVLTIDCSTRERFTKYQTIASEKLKCTMEEAQDLFISALERRGYTGFFGEAGWYISVNNTPGFSFEPSSRETDWKKKTDGLLQYGEKKKYIAIKSDYYRHYDWQAVLDEKEEQEKANLDAPSIHIFYNFKVKVPYFVTENGHCFYLPNCKVDFNKFKKFLLEKVLY